MKNTEKQLKMAQLHAELSEKKASIAEARWRAEASYATRITEAHDPNYLDIVIAERNRELARCESHEQAAVAEYHKAVAALMAEAAKGDPEDVVNAEKKEVEISLDGSQTSAMLAAMAILKDAPHIPADCSFDVSVMNSGNSCSLHLLAYNGNNEEGKRCHQLSLLNIYTKEEQIEKYNQWRKAVDFHFAQGKEGDNE